MELVRDLCEQGSMTGDACRSFSARIREIEKYSRDGTDPVDHFIAHEIATISSFLQILEDTANVREG